MPDMKTALETALSEWEKDDQQTINQQKEKAMPNPSPVVNFSKSADNKVRFVATVGVSEATFKYVTNNPGKSRQEIIKALTAQRFNTSSVGSLIGQFLRMGYFFRDGEAKIYTAFKDYKPLPSTASQKKLKKAQPQLKPVKLVKPAKTPKPQALNAGIAALERDSVKFKHFDPKELVNGLSVVQARELYDVLKHIFGG